MDRFHYRKINVIIIICSIIRYSPGPARISTRTAPPPQYKIIIISSSRALRSTRFWRLWAKRLVLVKNILLIRRNEFSSSSIHSATHSPIHPRVDLCKLYIACKRTRRMRTIGPFFAPPIVCPSKNSHLKFVGRSTS